MLLRLGRGIATGCGKGAGTDDGGAGPSPYLDNVINSVCCDLDATIAASYSGSGQTWANLIAGPADGAGQSDYDFYRGVSDSASTDDPAFNGSPGNSAAYWSFDGSDYFQLAGANTDFLNALHKTSGGTDWWFAIAFRNGASATYPLFGTTDDIVNNDGLLLRVNGQEKLNLIQNGNGSFAFKNSTATFTDGNDVLLVFSYNTTTNAVRMWVDTAGMETGTFVMETTAADAAGKATIGAESDGGQALPSGSRLYSLAFGNEFISDAQAEDIARHLTSRHNRGYWGFVP